MGWGRGGVVGVGGVEAPLLPQLPGGDSQPPTLPSPPIPGGSLRGRGPGPGVCTPCSELWGRALNICQHLHSPCKYSHTEGVQHYRAKKNILIGRKKLFLCF